MALLYLSLTAVIYARCLLNRNHCLLSNEKYELMTLPESCDSKMKVKAILEVVAHVPSQASWLQEGTCRVLTYKYVFNVCTIFARIGLLIKIVHLLKI